MGGGGGLAIETDKGEDRNMRYSQRGGERLNAEVTCFDKEAERRECRVLKEIIITLCILAEINLSAMDRVCVCICVCVCVCVCVRVCVSEMEEKRTRASIHRCPCPFRDSPPHWVKRNHTQCLVAREQK